MQCVLSHTHTCIGMLCVCSLAVYAVWLRVPAIVSAVHLPPPLPPPRVHPVSECLHRRVVCSSSVCVCVPLIQRVCAVCGCYEWLAAASSSQSRRVCVTLQFSHPTSVTHDDDATRSVPAALCEMPSGRASHDDA